MANEHRFDSSLPETNASDSVKQNVHSFEATIVNKTYFQAVSDGYTPSDSLRVRINSRMTVHPVNILQNLGLSAEISMPISVATIVSDNVEDIRLEISIPPTIEISTLNMNQGMETILFNIPFELEVSETITQGIGLNTLDSSMLLEISPLFKQYYKLDDWDGYSLSALDTEYLVDLDYQLV